MQDDYIMFDIGANIGATSLYSAQNKHIKHIYAFEPFKQTFEQAQANLDRNPDLSHKISIFQYGLGATEQRLNIQYNPELPGSMSTTHDRFAANEGTIVETVHIQNATEILAPLVDQHLEKIFIKIDCEGAENDILLNLNDSGVLKKVDALVLEWHFEYPNILIELLKKNGFVVFVNHTVINELGMIRAVRQKS